jgi:hypothetical protein
MNDAAYLKATIGDEPRIAQRRAMVNRDRRFAVLVRCSAGAKAGHDGSQG